MLGSDKVDELLNLSNLVGAVPTAAVDRMARGERIIRHKTTCVRAPQWQADAIGHETRRFTPARAAREAA